jgi:hypothetical protein
MKTSVVIGVFTVVVLLAVGVFAFQTATPEFQAEDSQIEPAGDPSPAPEGRVASGYVAGHVSIGPNCPGPEREGQPCGTPPEAYSSREVVVYDSDGITVNVKGKIDDKGNYNIPLGPGKYFIQIQPAGIGPGEKKPVTIKSFETIRVDFDIDTGIR